MGVVGVVGVRNRYKETSLFIHYRELLFFIHKVLRVENNSADSSFDDDSKDLQKK